MDHETFYFLVKVEWFLASYCVDTPEIRLGIATLNFKKGWSTSPLQKSYQKTSFTNMNFNHQVLLLCPTIFSPNCSGEDGSYSGVIEASIWQAPCKAMR